jgi:hypothetical protein
MFYQVLGHDEKPYGMWTHNLATGEELQRCPMRDLLEADEQVLREVNTHRTELYPLFRKGHLLNAGGLADQSARYLSFMRYCDRTADAVEDRVIKAQMPDKEEVEQ